MTEKKKPTISTEFQKDILDPEKRKDDPGLVGHPQEHFDAEKGADEEFKKVPPTQRTESDLKQKVKDYNESTRAVIEPIEIKHAVFNHKRVWEDIYETHKGFNLGSIDFGKPGPAVIIGSGQSLDKAGPLLKDFKGAIFTSSSQATSLCYYGRSPDYIVALDPRTAVSEFSYVDTWDNRETVLIAHPCVSPVVLDFWPGKIFYYRIMEPSSTFYTNILSEQYDFVTLYLYLFSCAISAQLGIAKAMGYDPLFLVGCDFGAPNDIYRYTSYRWKTTSMDGMVPLENGGWKRETVQMDNVPEDFQMIKRNLEIEKSYPGKLAEEKAVIANNGVKTDAICVYYKRSIFCVARLDMSNIINTSTEGIVTEMPEVEIEEVIEQQGRGFEDRYFTEQQKKDSYEKYLASQNTFAVEFENHNMRFIESQDPLKELPGFLAGMAKYYKAQGQDPEKMMDMNKIMTRIQWLLKSNAEDKDAKKI